MSRTTEARAEADVKALDDVSAKDCILFSLKIDDHFERLEWLTMWTQGRYAEMHREYPEFKNPRWRHWSHEGTF